MKTPELGPEDREMLYVVTDLEGDMLPSTAVSVFPGVWQVRCAVPTVAAIAHDASALGRHAYVTRSEREAAETALALHLTKRRLR